MSETRLVVSVGATDIEVIWDDEPGRGGAAFGRRVARHTTRPRARYDGTGCTSETRREGRLVADSRRVRALAERRRVNPLKPFPQPGLGRVEGPALLEASLRPPGASETDMSKEHARAQ